MTCHGGFSLDEATRRTWYEPEAILKGIGLSAGMVFIDVGSGGGFFTLLAAEVVGKKGIIFAVDTDSKAIERLKAEVARKSLINIKTKVGIAEETVFCNACADIVFYSMVLHDFNDPLQVLQNAKKMLKLNGKLVDLDWKKKQMSFGPPEHIRFSEKKAADLAMQAGFTIESIKEAGPHHYVLIAKS